MASDDVETQKFKRFIRIKMVTTQFIKYSSFIDREDTNTMEYWMTLDKRTSDRHIEKL